MTIQNVHILGVKAPFSTRGKTPVKHGDKGKCTYPVMVVVCLLSDDEIDKKKQRRRALASTQV